ncbi:sickle tail protein-like [Embiotoca jacksoni]|uniref:sickle tail protein-like n=1 Tax=Embiotoca jacksoni TaxID=100190 RepID=UPI00370458D7
MRVVSPLEAQELRRTAGEVLQTLIISPQTKEVSEVQLSERPVLVLFREEKTVREAYKLLYSFLESSKPVPKPRLKSSHHPGLQGSLLEALRRGMETGDYMLTLEHTDEVKMTPEAQQSLVNRTPESSGSTSCVDSLASRRRASQDVRRSTYRRLDSLEETIRELENTLIEIGGHPTTEELYTETTTMSTPVRTTGSPTSETKKPPVPPKPTSLSTASTQVQCFHLLCRLLL